MIRTSPLRTLFDARWVWPSVAILLALTALIPVTAP